MSATRVQPVAAGHVVSPDATPANQASVEASCSVTLRPFLPVRAAWVCCAISSETRTAYGSDVRRKARARPVAAHQSRIASRAAGGTSASGSMGSATRPRYDRAARCGLQASQQPHGVHVVGFQGKVQSSTGCGALGVVTVLPA